MDGLPPDNVIQNIPLMDGGKGDSQANSPTSSAGGQARPKLKQVAISRSHASGYERPERARTSHACEPCRERKTKCDGERPSCRRCLHTGTGCHYGYGKGWKKRKTAEDLTVTSRKLARYEELLIEIFPLVSSDVRGMIDDARHQEFAPMISGESMDSSVSELLDSLGNIGAEMQGNSPSATRVALPSLTQSAPPYLGGARALSASLGPEVSQSHSPSQPAPSTSRSSIDDKSSNTALRLPSITRTGLLVDSASRNFSGQPSFGPSTEPQRGIAPQPDLSKSPPAGPAG